MDVLLKLCAAWFCRHQLLTDDELGPLYDLLIDEPPLIRHAIGELVYDHLIAQKIKSSHSGRKGILLLSVVLSNIKFDMQAC